MSDPLSRDFEVPAPLVEPTPRWIRVRAGDTVVGDSRQALLLIWYGPSMLPTYCLPPEDVRTNRLQPSSAPAGGAELLVHHDVHIGDRVFERAALQFRDPPSSLAALDGHWRSPGTVGSHGSRRRSRSTYTPATRRSASTSCRVTATCASSSMAR